MNIMSLWINIQLTSINVADNISFVCCHFDSNINHVYSYFLWIQSQFIETSNNQGFFVSFIERNNTKSQSVRFCKRRVKIWLNLSYVWVPNIFMIIPYKYKCVVWLQNCCSFILDSNQNQDGKRAGMSMFVKFFFWIY